MARTILEWKRFCLKYIPLRRVVISTNFYALWLTYSDVIQFLPAYVKLWGQMLISSWKSTGGFDLSFFPFCFRILKVFTKFCFLGSLEPSRNSTPAGFLLIDYYDAEVRFQCPSNHVQVMTNRGPKVLRKKCQHKINKLVPTEPFDQLENGLLMYVTNPKVHLSKASYIRDTCSPPLYGKKFHKTSSKNCFFDSKTMRLFLNIDSFNRNFRNPPINFNLFKQIVTKKIFKSRPSVGMRLQKQPWFNLAFHKLLSMQNFRQSWFLKCFLLTSFLQNFYFIDIIRIVFLQLCQNYLPPFLLLLPKNTPPPRSQCKGLKCSIGLSHKKTLQSVSSEKGLLDFPLTDSIDVTHSREDISLLTNFDVTTAFVLLCNPSWSPSNEVVRFMKLRVVSNPRHFVFLLRVLANSQKLCPALLPFANKAYILQKME
ncbi:hypothetical protein EGR_06876 [Echinococcus granulosus]|uniref:Uncharacterized protein n=1 Tax=Echinococcus granulosus TaxID=6210 RepID=W6UC76_ECHGR|nr:hypothetical protein EGR_06876 [Echinococcus granulosus]EUB58241.1 hypothetical protein EGR_06876 [Echinococcus granulosus]